MKPEFKRKVRVCIWCKTWASGGIESFLNNVLLHMDLDTMDIDIAVMQRKESVFTPKLESLGIRFFELSDSRNALFGGMIRLWKLLKTNRYDAIHANAFQSLQMMVLLLAKKAGIPVRIAHSHNTQLRKSRFYSLKKMAHFLGKTVLSPYATDFWACSSAAAQFMFSEHEMRRRSFVWIPNGIDLERFRFDEEIRESVRKSLKLTDSFVIGNVGRLCYQKNQAFLLDVCAELLKRGHDCKLLLVGNGEDQGLLQRRAEELKISDAVLFYGISDRVEELYWAMDAFAFPSRFEGLGIAAIEAQAAGLPVICSNKVPAEACVTPLFRQMPEDANLHDWVEALLKVTGASDRDGRFMHLLRKAGYGIKDVSLAVEQAYSGKILQKDKAN